MDRFKGFIFDIDGVLLRGKTALPGARELLHTLQSAGLPLVLLTNNSTRSRNDLNALMLSAGLPVTSDAIVSSTFAAARYLAKQASEKTVFVIGSPGLLEELAAANCLITQNPNEADYLVTGADRSITLDRLTKGVQALRHGARWLAVSLDRIHPMPDGVQAGGGAVAGALRYYVDREPDVTVCKPSREIFETALDHLGCSPEEVLLVGDTLTSDIQGGNNAGVTTALVLTGATSREKLEASSIQPDMVLENLESLQNQNISTVQDQPGNQLSKKIAIRGQKPEFRQAVYAVGAPDFLSEIRSSGITLVDEKEAERATHLVTGFRPEIHAEQFDRCLRPLIRSAGWIAVQEDSLARETVTPGGLLTGALSYCIERQPDLLIGRSSGKIQRHGAGNASILMESLGNILVESSAIPGKRKLFEQAARQAIAELREYPGQQLTLIHHIDGDGICATVILKTALEREGYRVETIGVEKLYTPILQLIFQKVETPLFFADLGGGAASEIVDINQGRQLVVILDHHHTSWDATQEHVREHVYNLCSERFGINGEEEASGACVAWAFARALTQRNDDLSDLALLGAQSDRHDRTHGRMIGLNRMALCKAHKNGSVTINTFAGGRESYTLSRAGAPRAAKVWADSLTLLGTVHLYRGGLQTAMEMGRSLFSLREKWEIRSAKRLQRRLFRLLRQEMQQRPVETEHLRIIDTGRRFEGMGLKMIGLFLEDPSVLNSGWIDPEKYLLGFQEVHPEAPGLGAVGEGWVKVSGRLPPHLEEQVRDGSMPGFKPLFSEAAEHLSISMDACHDYAAALIIPVNQKQTFLDRIESAVQQYLAKHGTRKTALQKRQQRLQHLMTHGVDVIVVGGGITGAGIALDAASRGLKVALFEQHDFSSGASMASSKILHGGLRYLTRFSLRLVFEALRERETLFALAPDMTRPLPFLFPLYRSPLSKFKKWPLWQLWETATGVSDWLLRLLTGREPKSLMAMARHAGLLRLALAGYASLAWIGRFSLRFRTLKGRTVPGYRMLTREEALGLEPHLNEKNLTGGALYWDGFMAPGDARITLRVIKKAERYGAICLNHSTVTGFLRDEQKKIHGVEIVDAVTRKALKIRAKTVINATGPWTDAMVRLAGSGESRLRPSKGIHLIVSRVRAKIHNAIVLEAPDKRVAWMIPWDDHVLIGTTDNTFHGSPESAQATREEVEDLLEMANRALPEARLSNQDIISITTGIRPLVAESARTGKAGRSEPSLSRDEAIWEEPGGLLNIAGGKFTTYRAMAAQCVDHAAKRLRAEFDMTVPKSSTHAITLEESTRKASVTKTWVQQNPELDARIIDDLPYRWVDIRWAVEEEQALTLMDVLRRRTTIFLKATDQGEAIAPHLADFMRNLLDTPEAWCDQQLALFRQSRTRRPE